MAGGHADLPPRVVPVGHSGQELGEFDKTILQGLRIESGRHEQTPKS